MLLFKSIKNIFTNYQEIKEINELLSITQRFEVAKMLREQKTYLEIAEKTGFTDASCLYRNFMSHYGVSPGKYRKEHMK